MSSDNRIDRCLHWNFILSVVNSRVNSVMSSDFGTALNSVVYGYLEREKERRERRRKFEEEFCLEME